MSATPKASRATKPAMSTAPIILVDTNIWLDNYLADRPHSAESRAFLTCATEQGALLVYPIHCLKDVFFLIQAHLKRLARQQGPLTESTALNIREMAWSCIQNMRELATAVGADESDGWLATKYRSFNNDLEDNMVLAAAERAKPAFLVTNDEQLLRKATIPAHTAEDATTLLQLNG